MGAEGNTLTLSELRKGWQDDIKAVMPGLMEQVLVDWAKNTYKPDPATDQLDTKAESGKAVQAVEAKQAEMEMGAHSLISSADNWKLPFIKEALPIGSAIVGGSVGAIQYKVVDGLAAKFLPGNLGALGNVAAQLIAASVLYKFESRYLGSMAAKFAAGTVIFGLALQYTPLGEWTAKIEDAIKKPLMLQGGMRQSMAMGMSEVGSSLAFSQHSIAY